MIKIHDQDFESFGIFNILYREEIYGELFQLYCDNPNETVFLEIDVDSIEGKHWKSKIRFDITKREVHLDVILNFYHKNEDFEKCVVIKKLKENIKEKCLESV